MSVSLLGLPGPSGLPAGDGRQGLLAPKHTLSLGELIPVV